MQLPQGYRWSLSGSFKREDEASGIMQTNMLLAICMIYIVMAALFESLLLPTSVITSLLFSFTGVFWAYFITGTHLSIMGMIGMLVLMGIVVNNGIVLVDRINQLLASGLQLADAIIEELFIADKTYINDGVYHCVRASATGNGRGTSRWRRPSVCTIGHCHYWWIDILYHY